MYLEFVLNNANDLFYTEQLFLGWLFISKIWVMLKTKKKLQYKAYVAINKIAYDFFRIREFENVDLNCNTVSKISLI